MRASDEQRQEVKGYERLLLRRTHEARTAAVIRERWNQSNPSFITSETVNGEPSPPPLLAVEPPRRPLRPAQR